MYFLKVSMFTEEEKKEITEFLLKTPGNVYIGGDSQTFYKDDKRYARFTIVLIVHINNNSGGKIFHYTETDPVYDKYLNKPRMRLMQEVHKIVDTYIEFGEVLEDRHIEIHLDLNASTVHGSNIVVKEALGYVLGMTGCHAKIKPQAWAGSHCGDYYVRGRHLRQSL